MINSNIEEDSTQHTVQIIAIPHNIALRDAKSELTGKSTGYSESLNFLLFPGDLMG